MVAELVMFEIATATAGATATSGLAAPVSAVVVMRVDRLGAQRQVGRAREDGLCWSAASARSLTMFRATEAPIPNEAEGPDGFGSAVAVDVEEEIAVRVTAPLLAFTDGGPCAAS